MDYKIIWEPKAIEDLARVVRFISRDDSIAAHKKGGAILQKVAMLSLFPRVGRRFARLNRDDVRELSFPPYRIFYHIKDAQGVVRVLKIWHGAGKEPRFGTGELNDRSLTVVRSLTAIAAMSLNRVIGNGNKIPWHLPEDFKWFKQVTMGHVLVMGRKTFESIGKPLPGRETIVLTRGGWSHPGVKTAAGRDQLPLPADDTRTVFIAGGADIYRQALPLCGELLLTLVKREVEGDAFLPAFEGQFEFVEKIRETAEFDILRYVKRDA